MKKETAIRVKGVSKTFRIPHEKITSLRSAATSLFKSHSYEEFRALSDVSFDVKKGEFFGIIGRNGSGKSTLLKILAGIYTPDKGTVSVNGLISPFLELGIGFNPELSGRDNVFLNATVLGLTQKEVEQKFDAIVQFSELERFIDQKLKNYSSGMQVRLAFAVSIFANREILLMDEVLAVGDSNFQAKCFEEFHKYKEMGRTVIIVTHDTSVVEKYCDRAMLLRAGKIERIGEPSEVVAEYVEQNMSDEEKRLLEEERRRVAQEEKERREREKEEKARRQKMAEEERKKAEEEERRKKEKERREREKEERKVAKIEKVMFVNSSGTTKNIFLNGETLTVRVFYNAELKLRDPIVGIVVKNLAGVNVFEVNTQYKRVKLGEVEGWGHVDFVFENYFSTGTYFVSPAIATSSAMIIDWKEKINSFRVVNKEYTSGSVADFKSKVVINA